MGIQIEVEGAVATIVLDDPDRRNALSLEICEAMSTAVADLERDDQVGALVVAARGPAFCAGADLSHLENSAREGLLAIYEGFMSIVRTSMPTVAAVGGPAVGAGLNLALACDVRVVSPKAIFDTRFLELGIHPGGGHTWMLQRLAGREVANAMILCGEAVQGQALVDRGLAWRCVPGDELLAVAKKLAAEAAAAPAYLSARTKRTMDETARVSTHEEALAIELDAQVWSIGQPAFAERLSRARRTPR